jgi:hypothetical protein
MNAFACLWDQWSELLRVVASAGFPIDDAASKFIRDAVTYGGVVVVLILLATHIVDALRGLLEAFRRLVDALKKLFGIGPKRPKRKSNNP